MGLGDEIMVTGEVKRLRATDSRRVLVRDKFNRPRWHELWVGNPGIVRRLGMGPTQFLVNGADRRPYIDYTRTTKDRWAYTGWRCTEGELFGIRPDARGSGRVLIEPTIKDNASPNKQWGAARWQALVDSRADIRWAQMCPPGEAALHGVERIETRSFRQAVGVLMSCDAAVLPEGGLHHAAAAVRKKVIVLFGGMTHPKNTGYTWHDNLFVDEPEALGWRIPHAACARAWDAITPDLVRYRLETLLDEQRTRRAA